jgi:predicted phosphodiesterase
MVSRVAVLSDIHGMLAPLDRVLAEPAVRDADLIVVTGDSTWGPQPVQVLDRLTQLGDRAVLVRGNVDREMLQIARGIITGLPDAALSVWGASQLSAEQLELLQEMPEQVTIDIDGFGPVFFCHATPRTDEEVVLVDSAPQRWAQVFSGLPTDVATVVCGHTHMPFVRLVDRRLVVNPGSVGLPYGRAGAHWAVLEDGAVTLRRTLLDPDALLRETTAGSGYPRITEWLDDYVRHPASDLEALATFRPREEL